MGKEKSFKLPRGYRLANLETGVLNYGGMDPWFDEHGPNIDVSFPLTRNGLRTLRLQDGTAVDPTRQEPYVSLDDGATPQELREAAIDPVYDSYYLEYGDDYD